jgi:CelD/BcsL family acetyltransferase involved in cellulose biosynthesis
MTVGVETYTSVEPLADEWEELADRTGASPFLRAGWIGAWWRAFGSGLLEVRTVRRDGELAAVLPVVWRRGGVHSPTNWHTPAFGALAADADAEYEIYARLFRERPGYAVLRFVPSDAAVAAARAARDTVWSRPLQSSPYVPLDGEPPTPGAKRLSRLRQARRKLEADGPVTLDVQTTTTELDEAFRLEGSGWKLEEGTAIVSQPELRRFYTDVAEWAAGRGLLRVAFLRVGETAVAVEILLCDGRRLYDLKGGYDEAYKKQSPGLLLAESVIGWAREQGLESFEFLGAPEPFKLEWTDRLREVRAIECFSHGPTGLAALAAYRYGRPLAKRFS